MASRDKDLLTRSLHSRSQGSRSGQILRAYQSPSPILSRSVGEEDDHFDAHSIMDLKKQLMATKHELSMSKARCHEQNELLSQKDDIIVTLTHPEQLTRSISSSGHCNGDLSNLGPGSPYRTSSGSLNGLASKPSLNKELMQKLRSMTETIKMLSQENSSLRSENEEIRDDMLMENTPVPSLKSDNHLPKSSHVPKMDSQKNNDYDGLNQPQMISLILSYDEKVKALTAEVTELAKCRDEVHTKGAEKDKYKALARRLKEERNQYKESLDEKLNEQSELKDDMEKMSELIGELRDNCQKLQDELLLCRSHSQGRELSADQCHVSTQVRLPDIKPRASSLSNIRKTSANSVESVRKAKAVYGPPGKASNNVTKPRSSVSNSTSSSIVSLRDETARQKLNNLRSPQTRKPLRSPLPVNSPSKGGGGPRIAKPVVKPSPLPASSPSQKPLSYRSSSPLSAPKASKPSPIHGSSPARTSRIPQPSPSRLPSASRYQSPAFKKQESPRRLLVDTPSPPPPPPPSQLPEDERITPTPPQTPVQPEPYPERVELFDDEDDLDCSVLRVESDGKIQMEIKDRPSVVRSPVVPQQQSKGDPLGPDGSSSGESNADENDEPSADDEGDHTDEDPKSNADGTMDTPRTSRRRSEGGTLAARRVQRTWKHFYEEECHSDAETLLPESELLEERREQNPDLSLSKLAETTLSSNPSPNPDSMKSLITSSSPRDLDRKYSLPSNINEALLRSNEDLDESIDSIQAALQGHQNRSKSMSMLRQGLKIHIARPWLKKKTPLVEESSEEETDKVCGSIQSVIRAHDRRQKILQRLEADKDMFVSGKVDALKAKFNERRAKTAADRSDGVTDDDEDVIY